MLQSLLTHIPTTLVHILTGSIVMNIIFENQNYSLRKRLYIFLLGGLVVLIPDIPKLFGVVSLHSIFFVPFVGALLAFAMKKYLVLPFLKVWTGIIAVLIIAGIGIDYIGNGVHVFYPFSEQNYSFSILKHDVWLIIVLLTLVSLRIISPVFSNPNRARVILFSGFIVITLLLGMKSYSKIVVEHTLENRFSQVQHIETKPDFLNWNFIVYTKKEYINGTTKLIPEKIHINDRISFPREKRSGEKMG